MAGESGSCPAAEDERISEEEEDDSIGDGRYHNSDDEESFGSFDPRSSSSSSSSSATAPSLSRPPPDSEVEEIPSFRWLSQSFGRISGRSTRSKSARSSNSVEVGGNLLTSGKKKGSSRPFLLFFLRTSGKGRSSGSSDLFSRFWRRKRVVVADANGTVEDARADCNETEENNLRLVFVDDGGGDGIGGQNNRFSLEDMLSGSAEVLGKGCLGTGYKAVLQESRREVMVRRWKPSARLEPISGFEKLVDLLTRIRHPNILRLIAFYNSKEEKLLVFDYLPRGSLRRCLHGEDKNEGTAPLGWSERLNIALGVARGLAHIHLESPVAHGLIKSSNILLYEDGEACISDMGFGLSARKGLNLNGNEEDAPDDITRENDVYAFGVLLMELVTGKYPLKTVDVYHDDVAYLVNWVGSLVSVNRAADAFDKRLLSEANVQEMEALLHLSLNCVHPLPEERLEMADIQEILESISSGVAMDGVDQFPSTLTSQPADASASSSSSSSVSSILSSPLASLAESGKADQTLESASFDAEETNIYDTTALAAANEEVDNNPMVKTKAGHAEEDIDETVSSLGLDSTPLVEEEFDIGIPVGYSSTGPIKTYHAPLIKGVVAGLHETLKADLHFDEILQYIRSFTATLVMLSTSLEDWNILVQHVLQVVKQIGKLKEALAGYDVGLISSDINRLQDEIVDYARTAEEDSEKLEKSREELAAAQQEKASMDVAIASLEKQLNALQEQRDEIKRKYVAIELQVKSLSTQVSQHGTELGSLNVALQSTKEKFGQAKLEKEKNEVAISTLLESILFQVSSFSFQN